MNDTTDRPRGFALQMAEPPATDPVCGMSVDPATAAGHVTHAGTTYHFCSRHCVAKFEADPEKFLGARAQPDAHSCCGGASPQPPAEPPPAGTKWTCPMHPEVLTDRPDTCPKCGMALEPLVPQLGAEDDSELRDMQRRFRVAAGLALPVFVLAMAPMLPGLRASHAFMEAANRIGLLLATPAVFWAGWPVFERAARALRAGTANMFTLIAVGTGAAWAFSAVATLVPSAFPAGFADAHGVVHTYFEAAAVIIALVLLGQVLELRARHRTGEAVRALLALAPPVARRVNPDGTEADVPLADVRAGDRLRVRPGERVPTDGTVTDGTGLVDESALTGEPIPVPKRAGDPATGGTLNTTGSFLMTATHVGGATVLARIVALVAEAQRTRAPVQKLVDRVAAWFVPGVVAVAAGAFAAWAAFGPSPALAYALANAVAVLIIACPCALGLAAPMSVTVGIGRGATAGVLIRSAEVLERMERVDTLLVDKTGTLTEGKPRLVTVRAAAGFNEADLLRFAAALEAGSEHPLAAAVLAGAADRGLAVPKAAAFEALAGRGVRGTVEGRAVALGNRALVGASDWDAPADELRRAGQTVVFVTVDGAPIGLLGVADPIKATTPEALAHLRAAGVRVVMLTGDARGTAEAVAGHLGIEEVIAEALPERKLEEVNARRAAGRVVRRGERRTGAGRGRRGHRDGHRHRRGARRGRGGAGERRPAGYRRGAGAQPGYDAERAAEPRVRVRLQPARCAGRGRGAVPAVRAATGPDVRGGGDEPQLGVGDRQRAAPAPRAGVRSRPGGRRAGHNSPGLAGHECVLVLGLASALVALGTQVGWRELLNAL